MNVVRPIYRNWVYIFQFIKEYFCEFVGCGSECVKSLNIDDNKNADKGDNNSDYPFCKILEIFYHIIIGLIISIPPLYAGLNSNESET